jgi:hypothetical protein
MRKTMNYTKPEVAVLGAVVRVIENLFTKGTALLEAIRARKVSPAYDLDD